MKLGTNLAITAVFGVLTAGTAAANSINYYATGSFQTCTGCTFHTRTTSDTPPLPFGDASPNNEIQYTSGPDTVMIDYAFFGGVGSPSNVNSPTQVSYGIFKVSNAGSNATVNIGAFTFLLTVHDVTDNGTVTFTGSSSGGTVSTLSSTVNVAWVPAFTKLGPEFWGIFSPTQLVAPSTLIGETTIQGQVTETVPEPASLFLIGGGLLGVPFLARRKLSNQV